ncbi:MAG: metalloregulator ArsR/SmtB family transcription factor [Cyanobacteriota/Melainabacteria group bacterium]
MLLFFKALSDESRLKIVGILASGDRSVEELASLLELRAPTVSHHLSRLKKTGLVHMSTG